VTETHRARARDLGIIPGSLPAGAHNAITDVAGRERTGQFVRDRAGHRRPTHLPFPLHSRRLGRVAWRSIFGMARTGSDFSGRSGDYALAFSTAPADGEQLPDSALDPLFVAAIDVTEEAILNSLFMAGTVTGFQGHVRQAVPLDRVRRLCQAAGVLQAAD
jgi:L-aminopeptidase/D-esterase-like protein